MSDSPVQEWHQKNSRVVHENSWYSVRHDVIVDPKGTESDYFVVDVNPAVFIVARDSSGMIYLVKQYRHPSNLTAWEIPAGGTKPGEDLLLAAQRELSEETGLTAASWHHLGRLQSFAGISNEWAEVYLAEDVTQYAAHLDEGEAIVAVEKFSLDEIKQMIARAEIVSGQTVSSLFLFEMYIASL